MRLHRFLNPFIGVMVLTILVVAGFLTRHRWQDRFEPKDSTKAAEPLSAALGEATVVRLSEQAQKNLRVNPQPLRLLPFGRTIEVPGIVVDSPGVSDRGVTAPIAGVVAKIHAFPRDTVRPGDPLFTLRLVSEYVQNAQSELYKTDREIGYNRERWGRLSTEERSGTVPKNTVIEMENQYNRLLDQRKALRHDLQIRGLTPNQIDHVQAGTFVNEIVISAPPGHPDLPDLLPNSMRSAAGAIAYEVQELKVELGQHVQAGQVLADLANHELLLIEGQAFKREIPILEDAARNGWPLEVEFLGEGDRLDGERQMFAVRSIGGVMDPASNTVSFFVPLTNRAEAIERGGKLFLVWKYRPGQRVRLHVPTEPKSERLVIPTEAVVREGAEAYVFRQNGDFFERKPVHVLHEDRRVVVIADDGSVPPEVNVAFNAAAALNRAMKAQKSAGAPAGFHVHADGSVHVNH